ncbi:S-layer homology domain-containing protein [Peptoniphilus sp. GNH]|nr:hypothetical protein HMPREF3189_00361 [Clostridiales bacterium KA00134]UHR03402.1 S-layer homology domain-containing protein [Peptoniphilus sp. GNH]
MKKSARVLLLAMILFFTSTSFVFAKTFSDIKNHWARAYIESLSDSGFISGYEGNYFKPQNEISKVEFYSVVNNMANLKKTYTVTFSDVSPKDWYYTDVSKAIKAGYLVPTTGNLYPNKSILREEVVYVFAYMYNFQDRDLDFKKFEDAKDVNPAYQGAMGALVKAGVIEGSAGKLNPKGAITRGEFCAIAASLIDKYGLPGEKVVIDSKIKFGPRDMYK